MKLNQCSVSKVELEDKVRETRAEPKPPGGPSNIDDNEQKYKQRLFDWLVAASKGSVPLHAWCLARGVAPAVVATTVTKQDFKQFFNSLKF